MAETPSSNSPSRSSTPANNNSSRFTSQNQTAEELLKEQTVGLVHLSDFRKRRAEAIEQLSRDGTPGTSGATTPDGRDAASKPAVFKKRKKVVKKGGLSFGEDDEEEKGQAAQNSENNKPASTGNDDTEADNPPTTLKKRSLKPNTAAPLPAPKILTKSALARDAQLKDSLRREFAQMQEAVKATEFCLPFVFFDGKDAAGGVCRMKKGDFVWLFLDRARKVGAAGGGGGARKDWARIGVDDLMVVRGDVVVPHHYDFHHFIQNRTLGYNNTPIFPYSAEPTSATPKHLLPTASQPSQPTPPSTYLTTAPQRKAAATIAAENAAPKIPDSELEGYGDEPSLTKVVDRRWYERNKHIYPASMWEEFEPGKDYSKGGRKDGMGNAFFFGR
ncbi:hypothetical protein LTR37_008869 [Vermiconidia calcicola]|uniref:Uncharacterized protein n=1 Tax=Vermiconidia calcicola TaxID=1690605 RepID=A0ACC3N9B8_9PEZI|nr:hypothetical protein LTR37_008869 [Vermiconidia calcicola]